MLKNKKDGFISIVALIIMAILIPLLLFLVVDMQYYLQANKKVKSIVDNVAASASTTVIPDKLANGILELDYDKAETYIMEDLASWFNLEETIYTTNVDGVKLIKKQADKSSLFDTDPLIIRITPNMPAITNADVLNASRIEYFIHDSSGKKTYRFLSGQKVTVSTPTVGVKVSTRTRGVIFRIPISLKKIGMTEAVFDSRYTH